MNGIDVYVLLEIVFFSYGSMFGEGLLVVQEVGCGNWVVLLISIF